MASYGDFKLDESNENLLHYTVGGCNCTWDSKNMYNISSSPRVELEKHNRQWVTPTGRGSTYSDKTLSEIEQLGYRKAYNAVDGVNKFLKKNHTELLRQRAKQRANHLRQQTRNNATAPKAVTKQKLKSSKPNESSLVASSNSDQNDFRANADSNMGESLMLFNMIQRAEERNE